MGLMVKDEVFKVLFAGKGRICVNPAQKRCNALHEHRGAERFCNIVVGAGFISHKLVKFLAARGKHDNGYGGSFPDLAADLPAVESRHHYIKDHKINTVAVLNKKRICFIAVLSLKCFMTLSF